jgi:ABC-type transporter Mla subunit MlaD
MALDLGTINNVVAIVTGILDKAKDAAPTILEGAKALAAATQTFVDKVKSSIGSFTNMTQEQTKTALDNLSAKLDAALEAVQGAPTPEPAVEEPAPPPAEPPTAPAPPTSSTPTTG